MEEKVCEFSKPYFDGSIHYRKCLADVGGCGEAGWKYGYLLCEVRRRALEQEIPPPKPEDLVPEPVRWDEVFKRYKQGVPESQ